MAGQDGPRWRVLRLELDGGGLRLHGAYSGRMTQAEADAYAQRLADSAGAEVRAALDGDPARAYAPAPAPR